MKTLLEVLKQEGCVPSQEFLDLLKQDCEMFHRLGYEAGYADGCAETIQQFKDKE